MPRRLLLLLAAGLLAGCGGGKTVSTTTTSPAVPGPGAAMSALIARDPSLAGTVRVLFVGSDWAVVQSSEGSRASALAFHLAAAGWQPDRSGRVRIAILGPAPGARVAPISQVAMEITAAAPFVESALWVDGHELAEKGGGTPTNGTIYGAPARALKAGWHVAVGYARTATSGSARAWVFRVG